jgi:hypothetical protein
MHAFGKAVGCLRGAGYQVIEVDRPTPEARDVVVFDRRRTVYALVFLKSVALAKERSGPTIEMPPAFPKGESDRRGNVIVLSYHGGGMGPPKADDRRALDRCLPDG